MKAHQQTIGKNQEWLTPPYIIKALGHFDLDPCDVVGGSGTAEFSYWENGLETDWFGRVWLNPPFHRSERPVWMERMAEWNNGIMLIPAAGETEAFYKFVWGRATAILYLKGRPHFHFRDGRRAKANSGCTICLIAYGKDNARAMHESGLGFVLDIPEVLDLPEYLTQ